MTMSHITTLKYLKSVWSRWHLSLLLKMSTLKVDTLTPSKETQWIVPTLSSILKRPDEKIFWYEEPLEKIVVYVFVFLLYFHVFL